MENIFRLSYHLENIQMTTVQRHSTTSSQSMVLHSTFEQSITSYNDNALANQQNTSSSSITIPSSGKYIIRLLYQ
jgi:hypothetical protein